MLLLWPVINKLVRWSVATATLPPQRSCVILLARPCTGGNLRHKP